MAYIPSAAPNTVGIGDDAVVYHIPESAQAIVEGAASNSPSTKVGYFYAVISAASALSAFHGVKAGGLYFCSSADATVALALAVGDKAVEFKIDSANLLGFARDKSMSFSRNTFDTRTDADKIASQAADVVASISGSISGFNRRQSAGTAQSAFMSRFISTNMEKSDGTWESNSPDAVIDTLLFMWDGKSISAGDHFEATLLPCYLTSNERGASYGAAAPMSFNFVGTANNEKGASAAFCASTWAAAIA